MGTIALNMTMYFNPIMNLVHEAGDKRAGHDLLRESIFVRLLSYSADNFKFIDSNHFAKTVCVPSAQAKLVWDVCQKMGVLRPIEGGFSAMGWLVDNRLFLSKKAPKTKIQTGNDSKPEPDNKQETTQTENDQNVTKQTQEFTVVDRDIKEFVRPNVRLSRKEINSLKEQFSDEEIAKMLDKLSKYKTDSGKTYSSDYQAILRWVCKAVNKPQTVFVNQPGTFDLPDWMVETK